MENQLQFDHELLASKRLKGDELADEYVTRCFGSPIYKSEFYSLLSQVKYNSDLEHFANLSKGERIAGVARKLPSWADKRLMQLGSAFFVKHAEQIMQLLGLLSLPYCYAAADGAMVLFLSQRLRNDAHKRLLDTADFIWNVMAPNAFEKEGKGFAAIFRIRLTHAVARYYTLNSGTWDSALGCPINQEDMAGTNLSFSLIVIRGLRKLGYTISYRDQQAFLHLWNIIGCLLGLDEDLIPRIGKSANLLEQAIRKRHFKSSEQGRELTKALLHYFNQVTPPTVSQNETIQLMRYLLGNEISEILGLPDTELPAYVPAMFSLASKLPKLQSSDNLFILYQQKLKEFNGQHSL